MIGTLVVKCAQLCQGDAHNGLPPGGTREAGSYVPRSHAVHQTFPATDHVKEHVCVSRQTQRVCLDFTRSAPRGKNLTGVIYYFVGLDYVHGMLC